MRLYRAGRLRWTTRGERYIRVSLRSAQRAALYRAAAEVPGLKVVAGAKDAAGRPGTGIAWTYAGGPEMMWVFDAKTHQYLGTPTETSTSALVDKVGERP